MDLDIESLKLITTIGTSAAVVLYIYRIVCIIDLMRSESPKVEGMNRLIYAALIFFVPLGIGAWLYDFVVNDKKVSPLFLFPFLIVVTTFIQGMIVIMPHATNFNLDYVGW
jgi:hypothetical protein